MPTNTRTREQYRITCTDMSVDLRGDYTTALTRLIEIETLGACPEEHTIEMRDADGNWRPWHLAMAQRVLTSNLRDTIDTGDGPPLVLVQGGWSADTARTADAVAQPGTDEWLAALGPYERAILTSDGTSINNTQWCTCPNQAAATDWIRYERWTSQGRIAHGYCCPTCRAVTQTG